MNFLGICWVWPGRRTAAAQQELLSQEGKKLESELYFGDFNQAIAS